LAIVGAGGKTTLLFCLAREFVDQAGDGERASVLITTTTHLAESQVELADHHLVVTTPMDLQELEQGLPPGIVLVTGPLSADRRVTGIDAPTLARMAALSQRNNVPLLVEADGARLRPLKAPAAHEPALLDKNDILDMVIVVAGMTGLGKPLGSEWVHRPELFGELSGLAPEQAVTSQALTNVLTHPEGGRKGIPEHVRRVVALNQANTPVLQAQAGGIAQGLLKHFDAVLVADLPGKICAVHETVAGIIMAAGESKRFGQPKQILPWRGHPFVWHAAQAALEAGLSPVIVVSGAYVQEIRNALRGLPVQHVHNPDWELGQSTTLQSGLVHLPDKTGAAIFLLADQPQVPVSLLRKLVETHASSLSPLVAPQVDGRRANPVLFDRVTFPDLMTLRGDVGGRPLFSRYRAEWVPWHDASLLLDVDTPEDYARLLDIGG